MSVHTHVRERSAASDGGVRASLETIPKLAKLAFDRNTLIYKDTEQRLSLSGEIILQVRTRVETNAKS